MKKMTPTDLSLIHDDRREGCTSLVGVLFTSEQEFTSPTLRDKDHDQYNLSGCSMAGYSLRSKLQVNSRIKQYQHDEAGRYLVVLAR